MSEEHMYTTYFLFALNFSRIIDNFYHFLCTCIFSISHLLIPENNC